MATPAEKVLAELAEIATALGEAESIVRKLRKRRLALWVRGRKLKIQATVMAAASSTKADVVTPGDLRQYLWRHDKENRTDGTA